MQARKSLKNYFCSWIFIFLTIVQDTVHLAQNWIWGWRRQGLWWSRWAGSSQAHAKPAQDDSNPNPLIEGWNCDSSKPPGGVCRKDFGGRRNVESSWRCARIALPSQSSRSGSPGGKLVDHGRSLACPIIFMFSSPARMMLKMAGRIPTRSTRFILSEIKFFLLGQTRSRRKYLDIRKVISQRRVPWELIETHSIIW